MIVVHSANRALDSYQIVRRTSELPGYKVRPGRDHAPALSITDDMPEAGGGGASAGRADGPDTAASEESDGGDDPDPDRRRTRSKKTLPTFPPALLGFAHLSHYVNFGRSRIYQLINAGEFPRPLKIGKSSRWVRAEIDAWLAGKAAARSIDRVGG